MTRSPARRLAEGVYGPAPASSPGRPASSQGCLGHPGGSRVTNLRHGVVLEANQVSHGRRLDHSRLRIGSPGADQKRRVKCSSTFGEGTPKITRASLCRRPHRPGAAAGSRPDSSAENRGTIIAESGRTQPQLLRGTLNSCRIPEPAPTEEKQSGARTREFSPSAL